MAKFRSQSFGLAPRHCTSDSLKVDFGYGSRMQIITEKKFSLTQIAVQVTRIPLMSVQIVTMQVSHLNKSTLR